MKRRITIILTIALATMAGALTGQPTDFETGVRPALWGWNRGMLEGMDRPELCEVTDPRAMDWANDDHPNRPFPNTLAWCMAQPGNVLIVCRLGEAENAIDPRGFRLIPRNGNPGGIKILAGVTCPQGYLNIRTLSDVGQGGNTAVFLEDRGRPTGYVIADVVVWDNKCLNEPEAICSFDEQSPFRIYNSNVAVLDTCVVGNSSDDIINVSQSRDYPKPAKVLLFRSCAGPVAKIPVAADGHRGEGQCVPIGNAEEVALIQFWCLAGGHRTPVARGDRIYLRQSGVGGWGGRNFETAPDPRWDDGSELYRIIMDDFTYLGNMPPVTRQVSFILRFLNHPLQLTSLKAGNTQVFIGQVQGSDELGQPYRVTWQGRDAWLDRARCGNSAIPVDECRDYVTSQGDTVAFSEVELGDWFTTELPFEPPPSPILQVSAFEENIVRERIGPHHVYRCDGTIEKVPPPPVVQTMLRHARQGTTSPAGNDFPYRQSEWFEPWPDVPQAGANCPNADGDLFSDGFEERVNAHFGDPGNTTGLGMMDDRDGDTVPCWEEMAIHKTDCTVNDSEIVIPPPDTIPPPLPDSLPGCRAYLLNAQGDTVMTFRVVQPCQEGAILR